MTEKQEIVKIENLNIAYANNTVLENVNLTIKENDFLGVIGPNGGGKTTLLKVMLGLLNPSSGSVNIMGTSSQQARRYMGYIPQQNIFFDNDFPISVLETVVMGRLSQKKYFEYYNKDDKKIAQSALESVGMIEYKDRQISELSGGQLQRILIARALTTKPKLLLLDEPTSNVDSALQVGIYSLLKKLKSEMTIVIVSHDIGVISSYVEKIACLNKKLFYHDAKEITVEDLQKTYHCPVDVIAHGVPHRVMKEHSD